MTPAPTSIDRASPAGPGSIRQIVPCCSAATQMDPPPTAIPCVPSAPMRIFRPGRLVRGSMRVTTGPSRNQIPSLPAASLSADTSIVATSRPVSGSMRESVWSGLRAQTAPAPTAMSGRPQFSDGLRKLPAFLSASLTVRVIVVVAGSTRAMRTVKLPLRPGPPRPSQTAPAPAAMSVTTPPGSNRPVTAFVSGSMRETVPSSLLSTQTAPSPTATLLGAVWASVNDARRPVPGSIAATPLPSAATWSPPPPAVSATIPAAAAAHASSSPPSPISKPARRGARGRGSRRADAPSCGSCLRIACSSSCSDRPGSSPSSRTSVSRASRYTASDST